MFKENSWSEMPAISLCVIGLVMKDSHIGDLLGKLFFWGTCGTADVAILVKYEREL